MKNLREAIGPMGTPKTTTTSPRSFRTNLGRRRRMAPAPIPVSTEADGNGPREDTRWTINRNGRRSTRSNGKNGVRSRR